MTSAEADRFGELAVERRRLKRHDVVRREGEPADHVYFLVEGWVASSLGSAGGGSQIVKVHLPGDLMGTPSLVLSKAAETLQALTSQITVDVIPATRLGDMFVSSPKFAAAMFLASQQERIWIMDRLTSVGQTTAAQTLASFLLSIRERLSEVDPAAATHLDLPLSQSELANVLGVTPVHANRTLSQLVRTRLISRAGRRIIFEDIEGLRAFAGVARREFVSMPPWLKGARKAARAPAKSPADAG